MSTEDTQDNTENSLDHIDIGELRKAAKALKLPAERDWTKKDFIAAIQAKQRHTLEQIVLDSSSAPAPGYARIYCHRSSAPKSRNLPIQLAVNGRIIQIHRGVELDVPIPYVELLRNANYKVKVDQGSGKFVDEVVMSYPFETRATTPGPFLNSHDNRKANYVHRKKFFDKFERWPTHGELQESMKGNIRSMSDQ